MLEDKKIICEDKDGKKYEVFAGELSFRPAVYGIIIQNGEVLLSKQWDGYDFPGGGINLGETIEEALKREVKEETGFEVKIGKLVTCENSFYKRVKGDYIHAIFMYYLCEIIGGKLSTEFFDEHERKYLGEAEWIDLKNIEKIKIYTSCQWRKFFLNRSII